MGKEDITYDERCIAQGLRDLIQDGSIAVQMDGIIDGRSRKLAIEQQRYTGERRLQGNYNREMERLISE